MADISVSNIFTSNLAMASTSSSSSPSLALSMSDVIESSNRAWCTMSDFGLEFEDSTSQTATTTSSPPSFTIHDIPCFSDESFTSTSPPTLTSSSPPSTPPPQKTVCKRPRQKQRHSNSTGSSDSDEHTRPKDQKPKRHRKDRSELLRTLPPCRVCKESASGFHYGANTCEACKGFFRRALKHGATFTCKFHQNCDVTGLCRTLCTYCRYQKCLAVGMSKDAIKVGRYTHIARTRNIIEVKILSDQKQATSGRSDSSSACAVGANGRNNWHQQKKQDQEDIQSLLEHQHQLLHLEQRQISTPTTATSCSCRNDHVWTRTHEVEVGNASCLRCAHGPDKSDGTVEEDEGSKVSSQPSLSPQSSSSSFSSPSPSSSPPVAECSAVALPTSTDSLVRGLEQQLESAAKRTRHYNGDVLLTEHLALLEEYQRMMASLTNIPLYLKPCADEKLNSVIKTLVDAHNRHIIVSTHFSDNFIQQQLRDCLKQYRGRQKALGSLGNISEEEYMEIFNNTGMDVDGRFSAIKVHTGYFESFLFRIIRFAKSLPGFKELPLQDRTELLKAARADFWYLGAYRGFNFDLDTAIMPNGHCFHRTELQRMFQPDWVDMLFQNSVTFKKHTFRPEELVIMKALLFTMTDRCNVQNTRAVDEMQNLLLACLVHLLKRYHPERDYPHLVGDALNKLTILRPQSALEKLNIQKKFLIKSYKSRPLIQETVVCFYQNAPEEKTNGT